MCGSLVMSKIMRLSEQAEVLWDDRASITTSNINWLDVELSVAISHDWLCSIKHEIWFICSRSLKNKDGWVDRKTNWNPSESICPLSLLICQQRLNNLLIYLWLKLTEWVRGLEQAGDVSPCQPSVSELAILSNMSPYVPLLKWVSMCLAAVSLGHRGDGWGPEEMGCKRGQFWHSRVRSLPQ